MNKSIKIFGISFFILLVGIVFYFSMSLEEKNIFKVELIEINGNIHLMNDQYIKFANLEDKRTYTDLSLQVIKDRIEKHPYVAWVDVRPEEMGKVSVEIHEKDFAAIVMNNRTKYLLTKNLEVIPIAPFTKNINYPIISNPVAGDEIISMTYLSNKNDVVTGLKIIDSIELTSPELYDIISEINLRNGKDILVFFSAMPYPVVVGRDDEVKKMFCFSNLWSYLKENEINNYLDYIDLRYENHIYLGLNREG